MKTLFENMKRDYSGPSNHYESTFEYYNRSSRNDIETIRTLLNEWFDAYPYSERKELKSKFKSNFSSAFFELFIYQLFLNQGFELIPHPSIDNTNKHPDFLIRKGEIEFYLEAIESSGSSKMKKGSQNKFNLIYSEINKIKSPNFFIAIEEFILLQDKQPNIKRLRKYLEEEIAKCDPDVETEKWNNSGWNRSPKIYFKNENVKIVISLIPKSQKGRKKTGVLPIGIYPTKFFWGGSDKSIRTSIKKKVTRYGKIDKPYVICVNSMCDKGTDNDDVMNALFGTLKMSYSLDPNNRQENWFRESDGVFGVPNNPQFTRVSGIFITNINPANMGTALHWFIEHPFTKNPLDFSCIKLKNSYLDLKLNENKLMDRKGMNVKEILKIPDTWPNI